MKYKLQIKWGHCLCLQVCHHSSPWEDSKAWREFDDLEKAICAFEQNTNLARLAPAYQRIVDSDGNIVRFYDHRNWARGEGDGIISEPKELLMLDDRMRHSRIRDRAEDHWYHAGKPSGRDLEFWLIAEKEISEQIHNEKKKI